MVPAALAPVVLSSIVGVSILLMLIRPWGLPEVYWVGGGALLLVALRLVPPKAAAHAIAQGTDVYLFLVGMMLLSALAREHGVFDWLASIAVRRADGSNARLFTLIYGLGTLVTIFLSNDATAVVLTPAVLTAVKKARVEPRPHLFACALIANAASFVLPISNPANLVVFRQGMPSLPRWLAFFGLPSLLAIGATYLVIRLYFRNDLKGPMEETAQPVSLQPTAKVVLGGLGLTVAALLTASTFHRDLGLPTCVAALLVAAAVSLRARRSPLGAARDISWSTLCLVAGLFVMVNAIESIGGLRATQQALAWAQTLSPAAGTLVVGFVVSVANNLINNLPVGLIAGATIHAAHAHGAIAHAILVGVDLGPNLSITGSLATILWLIALRKENLNVSFLEFLRVGAVAMPVALLAALGGVMLMQHVLTAS